jgi:hypothetical protein
MTGPLLPLFWTQMMNPGHFSSSRSVFLSQVREHNEDFGKDPCSSGMVPLVAVVTTTKREKWSTQKQTQRQKGLKMWNTRDGDKFRREK